LGLGLTEHKQIKNTSQIFDQRNELFLKQIKHLENVNIALARENVLHKKQITELNQLL